MILDRKQIFFVLTLTTGILFLLYGCSSLPIIGKKKEKESEKVPVGKTVSIVGMEQVKGVTPPKSETQTPPKKPSTPSPPQKRSLQRRRRLLRPRQGRSAPPCLSSSPVTGRRSLSSISRIKQPIKKKRSAKR